MKFVIFMYAYKSFPYFALYPLISFQFTKRKIWQKSLANEEKKSFPPDNLVLAYKQREHGSLLSA